MIELLKSTFYYRPNNKDKLKEDSDLQDWIEAIALDFPQYGYRRITWQLKREGWSVNHKRVLRIMRESSLLVKPKKRWVKTTDSNHSYPEAVYNQKRLHSALGYLPPDEFEAQVVKEQNKQLAQAVLT